MGQIYNIPKISAVCCTYGRFKCVERAMNCFLAQDYPNKELIIYNTDIEHPYSTILPASHHLNDPYEAAILKDINIIIVNQNIDSVTKEPYTNVGAIRRDALMFATGDYVVTWDDDDIFLPHFMSQAINRMAETGLPSFKPEKSFFYSGDNLRLVMNTLEASVVSSMDLVRKYGYLLETGKEGLAWYTKMRDNKELDEHDTHYIPSYCFNWNDGQEMNAPHKQSGDIDNPNNFDNHKEQSLDKVDGRKLQVYSSEQKRKVYQPYYDFIQQNGDQFPKELIEKFEWLY
jgi:glycosyltransferase involved in cell wall biosynthesis